MALHFQSLVRLLWKLKKTQSAEPKMWERIGLGGVA